MTPKRPIRRSFRLPVALGMTMLLFGGCGSDDSTVPDAGSPTTMTTPASQLNPEPSGDPGPAGPGVTTEASPPPPASTGGDGILRSGLAATGEFWTNTIEQATSSEQPDVVHLVVEVETSLPLDADEAAREVQGILDHHRGWTGYQGKSFSLVNDPGAADLVVRIASPATVDLACGDLGTGGVWSCRTGDLVSLNADRWFYATPTWADYSIGEYRTYLVNHEVGHYLGFGHVGCPQPGGPSPVMQQQSIALNGCLPNGWPDITGERDSLG